VPNLKPNCKFTLLLVFGANIFLCPEIGFGFDKVWTIEWGTHLGPSSPLNTDLSDPSSIQYLYDIGGTKLATSGTGNSYDGDLIELGFFDTDGTIDGGSYTPNEDHTDLFKGVWTPLTSKTKIGRDWDATTVNAGEFYFNTVFERDSQANALINNYSVTNDGDANRLDNDYLGDNSNNPNNYENRMSAITDDTLVGIRFYDNTAASSGVARYNTIMDSAWDFGASGNFLTLHETDGSATRSTLAFEFENTSADAASKVGTSDTTINGLSEGDFVATVTYHNGSSDVNVGDAGIGSSVFSGLSGSGFIYGGETDANIVTLHSQSGNTGSNAYNFEGNFSRAVGGLASTDLTIVKSGTGDQILSGNLNLADSDSDSASGGLNITSGNLILKPASGNTQVVEYLTGAGGLKLDNSGVNDGTIVTLGFANQTSSTFSGTVVLDGNGAAGETKIKVSNSRGDSGFAASDFGDSQTLSGVISNANGNKKLVKDGTGQLVLSGNNIFTGGVEIEDGTLVAGHANALGSSNTVTITKGKLEVENVVTLAPTTITAGDSEKTMIGGRGTLDKSITIGGGNGEIDVISPGDGISSSLSTSDSQQQVSLGDRTNAIGTFTVSAPLVSDSLTLASGGVFDWEVSDFTGSAGSDWDLLKFDTLTISATTANPFIINVMSLAADGTAGPMAGGNVSQSYTSNGFKFMEATGNGSGWSGSAGLVDKFSVVSNNWAHYNNQHLHDWNVWYDGSGAFYLQYSAVPEPSTYMMVTGLLMVPGMSYLRRIRRKKNSVEE
jgi:autotransporter-associated beta strand protein